ncbi:MAG: hypothetical protein ACMG57_01685 [Candidatus Dojkabacteria bacterium]
MHNYKIEIANVDCKGCIGLIKLAFEDIENKLKDFNIVEISFENKFAKAEFNSSLDNTEVASILTPVFNTDLSKYTYKFI